MFRILSIEFPDFYNHHHGYFYIKIIHYVSSFSHYISSFIWIIRPREYKFSLELKKLKLHKNWNYWEAFYYHAIFLYPVKHQQWSLIKYNRNSLKMWIFYRHYQLMEMDIPFKVTIKYWLYSLWCIIYSYSLFGL